MSSDNPYSDLPPEAFWRSGVAETGAFGYASLWRSEWTLPGDARFATYGSCFAQHISRALLRRGMHWVDAEPAPGRTPEELAQRYNYGVFSARTGNIYTAAQLLTWARLAVAPEGAEAIEIWEAEDGWRDSLRPAIEPRPFASANEARASLASTARAFRRSVGRADVLVFTLGLTEGWEARKSRQPYAICPGTLAGRFDEELHRFRNYSYPETRADLSEALTLLRSVNPTLKVLLTVSPVPLTATASGGHVLPATVYSKSTLRAVAGDLAQAHSHIDYFPSYEVIAAPPSRGMFYAPNMRSVVQNGVDVVMEHFFAGLDTTAPRRGEDDGERADQERRDAIERQMDDEELVCEEMALEAYNEA